MKPLAEQLNPEQLRAATHTSGPLLILAGAGSGKTRVITYRIAHMIEVAGVPAERIVGLTFTNKAAGEMQERVAVLLGHRHGDKQPLLSTFHAFCARLLRTYAEVLGLPRGFTIFDDEDQRKTLARVVEQMGLDISPKDRRRYRDAIEDAKNKGQSPEAVMDLAIGREAELEAEVYAMYERELVRSGCVDFGGLILRSVELLTAHPSVRAACRRRWTHIMVDEFQDTNPAQYALLRALVGDDNNLAVVGDDDQSIYQWRGATVQNILDFEQDYPNAKVVVLERNYRSTQTILTAASAVIAGVARRRSKTLWTDRGDGDAIEVFTGRTEREEAHWVVRRIGQLSAQGISRHQCAIFVRTNAQVRVFEQQLRGRGIPYRVVGSVSFYGRREVKDILAYLKVANNPDDTTDLARIINNPPRKIGGKTQAALARLVTQGTVASLRAAVALAARGSVVGTAATRALAQFSAFIDRLVTAAQQGQRPSVLAQFVIEETGYYQWLARNDATTADDRRDNIDELVESLKVLEEANPALRLADALDGAALSPEPAGVQQPWLADDSVTLMTVHAAKGLEFDAVFVTGLEDRLFPLRRGDQDPEDSTLDEERRLAYVALTRARRRLHLSNAKTRRLFGREDTERSPSPFLAVLPSGTVKIAPESVEPRLDWSHMRRAASVRCGPRARPSGAVVQSEGWSPMPEPTYDQSVQEAPSNAPTDSDHAAPAGVTVSHRRYGFGTVLGTSDAGPGAHLKVQFPGLDQALTIDRRYLKFYG